MATGQTWNESGRADGPAVGWQPGIGTRELGPQRGILPPEEGATARWSEGGDGGAGRPLTPSEQRIHYDDKAQLQAEWEERRKAYEDEAERRHLIEREREREAHLREEERRQERERREAEAQGQPREWVEHSLRNEPTSALIRDFIAEAQFLASQEVRLAKAELREEAAAAGKGAAAVGVGGVHIVVGLIAIAGCLVAALAAVMPLWLSALLVGLVFVFAGALVAMGGMAKLKAIKSPEETAETLKEDREWASGLKRDVRSRRRAHA